ncbi:hypothetical protein E8M01_01725 [Phreatobacter stygius]|uniref:Uncharacterized protein n=1 Tax=Phreatobacter stygius TaxID=1940610 RepID=A0A4D7AZB9_9HYPH|nr:hypothetical protein E8M01_01725 [Phreatobacter stygius]
MAGLVPAIHDLLRPKTCVDGRDKPGQDEVQGLRGQASVGSIHSRSATCDPPVAFMWGFSVGGPGLADDL